MTAVPNPPVRKRLTPTFGLALVAFALLASALGIVALGPLSSPAAPHGTAPPVAAVAPSPDPGRYAFPPAPPVRGALGAIVNPTNGYSAEPAPMGVGDFGVSGSTGYTYMTPVWLGNFSWSKISVTSGSGNAFTVQLNVVLQYVEGGVTYDYWIQDVAQPTSESGNKLSMSILDNIWNFTSSSFTFPGTQPTGNGSVQADGSYQYYEYGPVSTPGAGVTLSAPNSFQLEARTFQQSNGEPVVRFCYQDDASSGWVCYDTVTFGGAKKVSTFDEFSVDGNAYNGAGLFTDGELDFTGPAGGNTGTVAATTVVDVSLFFWNGHNFEETPSAWNFGGDTGEKMQTVQSVWTQDGSGTPEDVELNGTTRDAAPAQSWLTSQLGNLVVWVPSITTGTVSVGATPWPYVGGWVSLNEQPGTYDVWDNASGGVTDYLGACTITAGATLNVSLSSQCSGGTAGGLNTGAPSPSTSSIDVGQSVTFTTSTGGGTSPYSYAWSTSPSTGLSCTAATSVPTTSCTASASNVYKVSVTVTDSASNTASATSASFSVYPTPTVAVPTASSYTVSLGSTVKFTSTLGLAGSGGDTYGWTASAGGLGCPASAALTVTCTPTATGTYTATITVTDSDSGTGSNTSATVTVQPANPAVSTPTASTTSADVGVSVTFTSTLTNPGAGGPSYVWSFSPATGLGCTSANALSIKCTPTAAGAYAITITVTDTAGHTGAATLSGYLVHPDPTVAVPTASTYTLTLGSSVSFSSSVGLAGSGSDTFAWSESGSGLGCPSPNALSVSCTPTAAGTYTATITVTDSNGGTGSNTSATVTVQSPNPSVSTPVASPTSADVGQSVMFTSTLLSSGAGNPSYAWTFSPATGLGCTSLNALSITCTPTAAGSYTITITVTDSAGHTGQAVLSGFGVSQAPAVAVPSPARAGTTVVSSDVGQATVFSTTATNIGSGGDTFAWSASPTGLGCASSTTATVTCTPTAAGSYTLTVTLTDSNHDSVHASASFTVYAAPSLGAPSFNPASPVVGQTVTFTPSVANGGAGSDTFSWSASSGSFGCGSGSGTTYVCVPTAVGTYTATVTMTDGNGATATETSSSVSVAAPTGPLAAQATASSTDPVAGTSVQFTASATGGTPPYVSYTWTFGDGTSSVTGLVVDHTFARVGTFVVHLTVVDSASASNESSLVVVTSPNTGTGGGGEPIVSYTVTPNPQYAGQSINFTASATRGTPGYSFDWRFGDGGSSVHASTTYTYQAAGSFVATLFVNDSAGHSVVVQIAITVASPAPQTNGGLTSLGSGWWLLLLALVIGIVILLAVAVATRRRRSEGAAVAGAEWSEGPAPAPPAPGAYGGVPAEMPPGPPVGAPAAEVAPMPSSDDVSSTVLEPPASVPQVVLPMDEQAPAPGPYLQAAPPRPPGGAPAAAPRPQDDPSRSVDEVAPDPNAFVRRPSNPPPRRPPPPPPPTAPTS